MAPKLDRYATGSWRRKGLLVNRARFNPLSDPALMVWLDATDDSTLTLVSGAASAWANKASTSLMPSVTQAVAAQRPTLVTGVLDGHQILRGTNAAVTLMQGSYSVALAQQNTIFIVARRTTINATNQYFLDSNTANRNAIFTQANTGRLQYYAGTSVTTTQSVAAWGVWIVLYNGASSQSWRGSTSLGVGNAGVFSMQGLTVFNYQGAGAFGLDGDIAEIFVLDANRGPNTTEGAMLLEYLLNKYPSAA